MNQQLPLGIQLNDEATIEDFCWEGNFELEQHIVKLLSNSEERFLTIWGSAGSGKTHLLQACCQISVTKTSIYLPLYILKEWGPASIDNAEQHNLIAIDDIDAIAKDRAWEEALFHLYNKVYANPASTLLISCSQPIATTKFKLADLHSRLSWGLVMQIHELADEAKISTIQRRAKQRGFDLSPNVAQFLIKRCARNMHDLDAILNKLDQASLAAQRKITVPFVKAILRI